MENEIERESELVAYCGLYCGACPQYLKKTCLGCQKNEQATWCKIRKCCKSNQFHSCADCSVNVVECTKFTNFVSKMFSFLFNSDRKACIKRIKLVGNEMYAKEMSEKGVHTIKRR